MIIIYICRPDIGEKDLQEAAHHYFEGDMKRAQLDRSFANDPSKKATMPDIRAGSSSDTGNYDSYCTLSLSHDRNLYHFLIFLQVIKTVTVYYHNHKIEICIIFCV